MVSKSSQKHIKKEKLDDKNINPASVAKTKSMSKRKPKLLKILFVFIFLFLFVSFSAATYAIAYEKIKIEKFPTVQKKIAHLVQSLPLLPKTPKFLLEKSAIAHQKVKKFLQQ